MRFLIKLPHCWYWGRDTSDTFPCSCFLYFKVPFLFKLLAIFLILGFPGGSEVKASACNVGDLDAIPGLGRSPGEGNGNPLQYYCLENPMGRGAWWAILYRVANSRTLLSNFTSLHFLIIKIEHFFLVNEGNSNSQVDMELDEVSHSQLWGGVMACWMVYPYVLHCPYGTHTYSSADCGDCSGVQKY